MTHRQPYEILDTFKPRRGALHLGNFASMGTVVTDPARDMNAAVYTANNAAFAAFGGYPSHPKTPITPLGVASSVTSVLVKAIPVARKVAESVGGSSVTQFNRAVARWMPTSVKTALHAAVVSATATLKAADAVTFWDEASRMAIQLNATLSLKPVSFGWDMLEFDPGYLVAEVEGRIARIASDVKAKIRAEAAAGATDQFKPGMPGANLVRDAAAAAAGPAAKAAVTPLVMGAIVVGGLGLVAGVWSLFKKRRK